ncbi:MAG TPA: N-acetylglucosamine-6-phosphate deacetylase [Anaerolineaceae bacterium]|nr:N-acetylglucosamine-6-phosphate deacetylase [Anaerolineaceae bacterium]
MNSTKFLFKNASIIGGALTTKQGWILTDGKKIVEVGLGENLPGIEEHADEVIDCLGSTLLPGLIDLHTHGAIGHEFMEPDVGVWQDLSRYYASHGTTSLLATTWTATEADLEKVIHTAQKVMGHEDGARILGVHLEGPYINRARSGAQDPMLIRTPGENEIQKYMASGVVKLIALAPEVEENAPLIRACVEHGITVSAGHTDATYEEMVAAVNAGVSQVTHCFNAMRPLNHRQPGTVGAALTLDKIRCELIADNIHIHPAVMELMARAKGMAGVILITDSIQPAGLPDGEYVVEGRRITLMNGEARLPDGTLAGSTLTLIKGLQNFMNAVHRPIDEAWVCASLNPAKAIHQDENKGSILPGKDADLILVDRNFEVLLTMVEGQVVFRRG